MFAKRQIKAEITSSELINLCLPSVTRLQSPEYTPEHHHQHLHPIILIPFNAVIITVLCVSLCVLLGALVESADGATVVEGHVARGDGHVTKHQRHRQDHVI